MNENTDESKFKRAYRDKVNFKTFNETDSDKYINSRFSLLRELATDAAPKVNDIKTAASVRELLSVKPKETEKTPSRVNLSSVALQTNRTSSLKSFLVQNTEQTYQNKISPLTDEPVTVKNTAHKKDSETLKEDVKISQKEETPSVTDSIPDVSNQSKPFAGLFRSSVSSEFKGRKNDSLQELYKRLLNSK